jgi:hypothetical protein
LRQEAGECQFGDCVVLEALKHDATAGAAADDDNDDTYVGFAAMWLVIITSRCEGSKETLFTSS